jgi:hypothetical protein
LAYTNYLTFDNNVAYDNGDYGIYMYAWGANLTNNVLNDNGLGGIWLRSSAINNNIGLPGQGNMFCGNGDPDARDDDTNNWTDNVCDTTAGNAECERKCQSVTCTVKGQKPGTSAMKPLEGATCSIYDRNDPVVNQHHPDVYAIYEYAEILNRLSSCITDGLGECSVFVGSGDRIFGISEHPDFPGDLAGHDLGVVRTDNKNLVMTHPAGGNVNETATLGEGLSLPLLLVVLAIVGALAFAVQSLTKKRKR